MGEKDLRLFVISWQPVHGRTIHRIATRRIPAVGPIKGPIGEVKVQIDWLRQFFIKKFHVSAIRRCVHPLALGPREFRSSAHPGLLASPAYLRGLTSRAFRSSSPV